MKKFVSFFAKVSFFAFITLAVAPVAAPIVANDSYAQAAAGAAADTTEQNILTKTMCRALDIVQGSAGKAFAAFAIISVGIGFFTGKVSWGLMIGVAAGIAAMFGAPSIVKAISGDSAVNCTQFSDITNTQLNQ